MGIAYFILWFLIVVSMHAAKPLKFWVNALITNPQIYQLWQFTNIQFANPLMHVQYCMKKIKTKFKICIFLNSSTVGYIPFNLG